MIKYETRTASTATERGAIETYCSASRSGFPDCHPRPRRETPSNRLRRDRHIIGGVLLAARRPNKPEETGHRTKSHMIRFYFHPAPNPAKIALFLEEAGLP
jgi:pimeloyl-ACP methyl ester carboxylesterase